MLEELQEVRWEKLSHAHGSAEDVPSLLLALASNDEDAQLEASAQLHETLWHQGTVYSASAGALPFLFELISSLTTDHSSLKNRLVVALICCIATGEGWIQYGLRSYGSEEKLRDSFVLQGRSLEDETRAESFALASIQERVAADLHLLEPYLDAPEGLGDFVEEVLFQYKAS